MQSSLRDQLSQIRDSSQPIARVKEESVRLFRDSLPTPDLRLAFDVLYVTLTWPENDDPLRQILSKTSGCAVDRVPDPV